MSSPTSPRCADVVATRRDALAALAALGAGVLVPASAAAQMPIDIGVRAVKELVGDKRVMLGRVQAAVPTLTDNGNSVPIRITVQSPMTEADHVRRVHLYVEGNPRPKIAVYEFGPHAARAEVSTRIRLAGTTRVYAIAELSSGEFWADARDVTVTISACLDGS
jgi:sulfur-oxidizing protein SoxY